MRARWLLVLVTAPALDENGLPNDPIAICEDVIGANVDGTGGG